MTEAITRPDGRLYRPRKLVGYPIDDEDGIIYGVMVLGTHDTERAEPLAQYVVAAYLDRGYRAAMPSTGWFRDGFEAGRRRWVVDGVKGRAGVWFRVIEAPPEPAEPSRDGGGS